MNFELLATFLSLAASNKSAGLAFQKGVWELEFDHRRFLYPGEEAWGRGYVFVHCFVWDTCVKNWLIFSIETDTANKGY